MRLKEFEGKEIFRKYKIKTPKYIIISKLNELNNIKKLNCQDYTVKAQLLIGSRGKIGAIKFADKSNIKAISSALLKKKFKGIKATELLIEEKIKLDRQIYLGITISRETRDYILIYSEKGGIDIEEISQTDPSSIKKITFFKPTSKNLSKIFNDSKNKKELTDVAIKLYKIIFDYDAILAEINPLTISNKKIIALDSKIIIDDNSLFRHPEFIKEKEIQLSKLEREAFHLGISYVPLKGNIAIISNGAGLVMATLDLVKFYGGKPANFLDIGAGAGMKEIYDGLKLLLEEKPKGIFINIFAGMTRCDEIAEGITNFKKQYKIKMPFVVRMIGTNEDEAKRILKNENIEMLDSMELCVKKIINLVK